ncbi:peptidylprolyl isomerase [Gigaspora margarita]|uniref:peptidylprolyl isomerase n=1 Tax=Gigaspora margarita TaxID=4874 RepID=A0A8H4AVW9_GIGMA|nr:peptidylprolyl isomerase [Gigaspora margarita]
MGVEIKTLKEGDGKTFPKKGDTVKIHYTGKLAANGTQFDSSYNRGKPFECKIGVGQVIRGWDEGVPQLSLGQKAILTISPDYGYEKGFGEIIPPNSTLIFEVELLEIS